MFVDTTLNLALAITSSGGGTGYLQMPFRGKVKSLRGVLQGAPGVASLDLTLTAPSHGSGITLGVLNFAGASSASLAAKGTGTYTPDTTNGTAMLSANSILQFAVSAASVSSTTSLTVYADIDPYGAG